MTTSWSHALRGELRPALRANVGGVLLVISTLLGAPVLLLSAMRGRWIVAMPTTEAWAVAVLLLAAVTLIDWAVRIVAELN